MKRIVFVIALLLIGSIIYCQKNLPSDTTQKKIKSSSLSNKSLTNDSQKPKESKESQSQEDIKDKKETQDVKYTAGASGVKRSISYKFSSLLKEVDPGNGIFRFDEGIVSKVKYFYVDDIDLSGEDQSKWYATWDDTTGAMGRGQITIVESEGGNVCAFNVTGVLIKETGFWKIPVMYVSGILPVDGSTYYYIFDRIKHKKEKIDQDNQGNQVVKEPQPVQVAQVIQEPEPVMVPQVVQEPQPVKEPQVIQEPQPAKEPQVVKEPQTVKEPHGLQKPLPVQEKQVIRDSQPVQGNQVTQVSQPPRKTQPTQTSVAASVRQRIETTEQPKPTQETQITQVKQTPQTTQSTQSAQGTQTTKTTQSSQPAQPVQPAQPAQVAHDTQEAQSSQKITGTQSKVVIYDNYYGVPQNNSGRAGAKHRKCYRGIIEIGYAIGVGDYGINNFRFNFINGFNIGPCSSIGLGIGVRWFFEEYEDYTDRSLVSSEVQIPVFLDLRTTFSTRKVTPYLAFGIGNSAGFDSDKTTQEGLLLNASGGIWFNISDRFAFFAGIAFEMQKLEYLYIADDSHFKKNTSSVSLNVGISF